MRTNYGICIRVWVYRPMLRYICYYSTLMAAFLQVKKHRNTPQACLRTTSPALRATSPCRGGFGIPQSFPSSPEAPLLGELSSAARLRGCTSQQLLSKSAKSPPHPCGGPEKPYAVLSDGDGEVGVAGGVGAAQLHAAVVALHLRDASRI